MENTVDLAPFLAFTVFLALQVTAIVEFIKQSYLKPYFLKKYEGQDETAVPPQEAGSFVYARTVNVIAFAVGLAVSIIYYSLGVELNILAAFGFTFAVPAFISILLTAFVISFGNQNVHIVFDMAKAALETVQLYNMTLSKQLPPAPAPVNTPANSYPYTANENVGASLLG